MGRRRTAFAATDLVPRSALICWMTCAFGGGALLASGCGSPKSGSSGSGGTTGSGGMTAGTGGASGGGSGTGGSATGGIGAGGAGGLATGGIGGGGRGGATGLGTGGAATGGAGGSGEGGAVGVSYSGCSYVGGLDRVVVAKRDAGRNLCVVIVFANGTNTSQVVLPQSYRVEFAFAFSPGAACAERAPPANSIPATGETGTATWTSGVSWPYGTANVDVALAFPPGSAGLMTSETIQAAAVDVSALCQ